MNRLEHEDYTDSIAEKVKLEQLRDKDVFYYYHTDLMTSYDRVSRYTKVHFTHRERFFSLIIHIDKIINLAGSSAYVELNKYFKDPLEPTEEECTLFEIDHPDLPILFRKGVSH